MTEIHCDIAGIFLFRVCVCVCYLYALTNSTAYLVILMLVFSILQMIQERFKLPVAESREYILQCIRNSQVTLVRGETGCGKTTQVQPSYCSFNS